jgi:hypothetical protein
MPDLPQFAHLAYELVRDAQAQALCVRENNGAMPALGELGTRLKGLLFDVSDGLTVLHFNHLTSSRLIAPF